MFHKKFLTKTLKSTSTLAIAAALGMALTSSPWAMEDENKNLLTVKTLPLDLKSLNLPEKGYTNAAFAYAYAIQRKWERAAKYYGFAIKKDSNFSEQDYVNFGFVNYKLGKYDDALQLFNTFLQKIHKKSLIWLCHPTILQAMKGLFQGEQEYKKYAEWVIKHDIEMIIEKRRVIPLTPLEIPELVSYIDDFNDLKGHKILSETCTFFHRIIQQKARAIHDLIAEKLQKLSQDNQKIIRSIFKHEIDCNHHRHVRVLKFIDSFNKDPQKYRTLYGHLSKFLKVPNFPFATLMVHAQSFDLLNLSSYDCESFVKNLTHFPLEKSDVLWPHASSIFQNIESHNRADFLQNLPILSVEQLKIVGKYGDILIPQLTFGSYYKEYLEQLSLFPMETLEVLGLNAPSIFQNVGSHNRVEFLKYLPILSVEQFKIVGKYGDILIPKLTFGPCYKEYLAPLSTFSLERLEIVGKYGNVLIPKLTFGSEYKKYLEEQLSFFPIELLDALGRNVPSILQNVEERDRPKGIKLLSAFSSEQLDILGRSAPLIFENIKNDNKYKESDDRLELLKYLPILSVAQLKTVGKYGNVLIPQLTWSSDYKQLLEKFSRLQPEILESMGKNTPAIQEGNIAKTLNQESTKYEEKIIQSEVDEEKPVTTQYIIGGLHYQRNFKEALEYFTRAAEKGNILAKYNIAVMYLGGEGISQDNFKALELFQEVYNRLELMEAKIGIADAEYAIGIQYFNGKGVPRNYFKALEWFEKAERNEHPQGKAGISTAQFNIGLDFLNKGNNIKALEWFERAEKMGYSEAYTFIGTALYSIGVVHYRANSYLEALKYFEDGAARGHQEATKALLKVQYKLALENPTVALRLIQEAKKSDNYSVIQYIIGGRLCEKGDFKGGLEFLKKSFDQGYEPGKQKIELYRNL